METLGRDLRKVLQALGSVSSARGYHLAGGTALALQLGHRRSDDADWFSASAPDDALVLAQVVRQVVPEFTVVSTGPGTLHGRVGAVRASWHQYPYPLLAPLTDVPDLACSLASLDDIAAMKLAAIGQRGARKDFLDLHVLVAAHRPLYQLVELYRRRYGIADVGHVLIGLTYFDEADGEPSPRSLRPVEWRRVKHDIIRWVRDLADAPTS